MGVSETNTAMSRPGGPEVEVQEDDTRRSMSRRRNGAAPSISAIPGTTINTKTTPGWKFTA